MPAFVRVIETLLLVVPLLTALILARIDRRRQVRFHQISALAYLTICTATLLRISDDDLYDCVRAGAEIGCRLLALALVPAFLLAAYRLYLYLFVLRISRRRGREQHIFPFLLLAAWFAVVFLDAFLLIVPAWVILTYLIARWLGSTYLVRRLLAIFDDY